MKRYTATGFILLSLVTTGVQAHGQHGLDHQQRYVKAPVAKDLAIRTLQKMTLRDLGFSAGKLNTRWRSVKDIDIVLRQEEDTFYVFSAQHKNSTKTLMITVLKTGVTESVSVTQPTHQGN